jgi:AcrR family transcriptional regulator
VGTNSFYDLFSSKEDVLVQLYDELTGGLRDAVAEAHVDHRASEDPIRPLVSAFVHGAVDDARVAQVVFIESAGVSSAVEAHRRDLRNQFVAGLQAIGSDLRDAALDGTSADLASRVGPSPRRNAVAVVGAIIEMTVDWLHDPDRDPLDRLIDDIAHHCRQVLTAAIDGTPSTTRQEAARVRAARRPSRTDRSSGSRGYGGPPSPPGGPAP